MDGSLGEFKADMEGLFERIGRAVKRSSWAAGTGGEKIRTAVIDHGNPGMMHGSKASTCLGCKDDEEVVMNFVDVVESDDFVFVRLMGLAGARGWVTARTNPSDSVPGSATAPPPPTEPTSELLSSTLLETSARLQTIHSSLPARSALLIFTRHSDSHRMSELNKRKAAFEASIRKGLSVGQLRVSDGRLRI